MWEGGGSPGEGRLKSMAGVSQKRVFEVKAEDLTRYGQPSRHVPFNHA